MKKSLLPTLAAVLCLAGCLSATTPIKLDQETSQEKSFTLNIAATLIVKQFDGRDVDWAAAPGDSWASVRLPEGSHTFMIDYSRRVGWGTHYRDAVKVGPRDFLAGRTYRMWGAEGAEVVGGPRSGMEGFMNMLRNPLRAMEATVNKELVIMFDEVEEK
jgi:hypothetical protein